MGKLIIIFCVEKLTRKKFVWIERERLSDCFPVVQKEQRRRRREEEQRRRRRREEEQRSNTFAQMSSATFNDETFNYYQVCGGVGCISGLQQVFKKKDDDDDEKEKEHYLNGGNTHEMVSPEEEHDDERTTERKHLPTRLHRGKPAGVFSLRCVITVAGVGEIVGGTLYVLNRIKNDPDVLANLVERLPDGISVIRVEFGLELQICARDLFAMEELRERYDSGQLKKDLEEFMITDELQHLATGEAIEFVVEMDEDEYNQALQNLYDNQETTDDATTEQEGEDNLKEENTYQTMSVEEEEEEEEDEKTRERETTTTPTGCREPAGQAESQSATASIYEKRPRINKPDMFMMTTALMMERSPQAERPELKKYNKSGAAVVLPNERAFSVDCSQGGIHAAVSALNKFGHERAKGCQVYLSRRPCSYCAKLLVQCELAKVYYLPIEPELNDKNDVQKVDKLFKASSTSLSVFIPKISRNVIGVVRHRTSRFVDQYRDETAIKEYQKQLIKEYWSDEWIRRASRDLEWPAFDKNMQEQTQNDMYNLMEWIARATVGDVPDRKFVEIDPYALEGVPFKKATQTGVYDKLPTAEEIIPSIPIPNEPSWQRHALHMVRMAQMLSQRSDDPSNPVGCILMVHGEVVAIGWNGFPAKALYGEFPRASSTGQGASRDKKEPYVIHAEQNALLTRNKRNMNHKSSILYSNKVPCGECVALLIQAGVKNVVVPCEPLEEDPHNRAFLAALKKGNLKGYWPASDEKVENRYRES